MQGSGACAHARTGLRREDKAVFRMCGLQHRDARRTATGSVYHGKIKIGTFPVEKKAWKVPGPVAVVRPQRV